MLRKKTDGYNVWARTFSDEGNYAGVSIGVRARYTDDDVEEEDFGIVSLEYNKYAKNMVLVVNKEMLEKLCIETVEVTDSVFSTSDNPFTK